MTARVSKNPVTFSRRAAGNKMIELIQEGPFINVRINGVHVGGVRRAKELLSQPECTAELCIVLRDYVIELTDVEQAQVTAFTYQGVIPEAVD